VDDTQGSPIKENPVIAAAGSNLEKDNALFNPAVVCGYVQGYQASPISVTFNYPRWWKVGTALQLRDGTYYTKSFDELVDSPFLFGDLTTASLRISNTTIDIFCYSEHKLLSATLFADSIKPVILGVEKFLTKLPVPRYVFLFFFKKEAVGWALEHNYSSVHALREAKPELLFRPPFDINGVIVHEFCHTVTPLRLHSDVIEPFNFECPVASRHIWLYEGATEWLTGMALLAGGTLSDEEFLKRRITKARQMVDVYDSTVSLVQGSLGCYDRYEREWANAYGKGQLVTQFMDMRLKELSHGAVGLRELILKLMEEYGDGKTFPDEKLFDIMVSLSYPELRETIDKYLLGTEPLPMKEYLAKVGYEYVPELRTGKYKSYIRRWKHDTKNGVSGIIKDLDTTDAVVKQLGIRNGDIRKGMVYRETEIRVEESRYFRVAPDSIEIDEPFAFIVERDGKELRLHARAGKEEVIEKHKIVPMSNPANEQLELRSWWLSH
jgi:predicted metalloprotease with PDZ domain